MTRKQRLEKEEKKRADEETLKSVPELLRQIEDLDREVMTQQYEIEKSESDRLILKRLYDEGYTDSEGNVLK